MKNTDLGEMWVYLETAPEQRSEPSPPTQTGQAEKPGWPRPPDALTRPAPPDIRPDQSCSPSAGPLVGPAPTSGH
jgi:hypothetical protein